MTEPMFELVMPIEQALREAADVPLPEQPEPDGGWLPDQLVDVLAVDPTLKLDIRYATDDNFMGAAVYDVAAAVLHRPVAEDLARCHSELKQDGYGITVYDGYRPFLITVAMYLATPAPLRDEFLAKPARGSIHNRAAAVDIGLFHLDTGKPAPMPSAYDEFTDRAAVTYADGPQEPLARRDRLIAVMADHGFAVYKGEWWHFNHPDAKRYRINNTPLKDVLDQAQDPATP